MIDYTPFGTPSDRGSPQHVQHSKRFFPPKLCLTCSKPFQGSECPSCDSVPEDA